MLWMRYRLIYSALHFLFKGEMTKITFLVSTFVKSKFNWFLVSNENWNFEIGIFCILMEFQTHSKSVKMKVKKLCYVPEIFSIHFQNFGAVQTFLCISEILVHFASFRCFSEILEHFRNSRCNFKIFFHFQISWSISTLSMHFRNSQYI